MAKSKSSMMAVECPECDADIIFKNRPRLGNKVVCNVCNARLAVIAIHPVELGWAEEYLDVFEDADQGWQYGAEKRP